MKLGKAAGEFAVIVLGVLVALSLESAWEDWQEARLAESYLGRLADEAAWNKQQLAYDLRWMGITCPAAEALQQELWAGGETPDSVLFTQAYVVALHRGSTVRTSTYEDLVATGRLGLIEDPELRDRILLFYETGMAAQETWRPTQDNEYRQSVLRAIPSGWAADELVPCIRNEEAEIRDDWQACSIPPAGGATLWLERLRAREGLADALSDRVYDTCNYAGVMEPNIAALDTLAMTLERVMRR